MQIFSGGDKTLVCTDSHTGEQRAVVARDAGDLTALLEHDGMVYAASTAGVFRAFAMTFTGKNMVSTRAFIGHSKVPPEPSLPTHCSYPHILPTDPFISSSPSFTSSPSPAPLFCARCVQAINAVAAATPSADRCRAHKILGHVCYLYSAAEDRTLRVWDLYEGRLVATVRELPGGARALTSSWRNPPRS